MNESVLIGRMAHIPEACIRPRRRGQRALAVFGILAGLFLNLAPLLGANWPNWRGPFLNGSTTETKLPVHWSPTENLAWVAPMPGASGATPVVWGSRVFAVSPDAEKRLWLMCFDQNDGKLRWQTQAGSGDRVTGKNNMASCSPVTDGKAVYALFGTSDFVACDFGGSVLWRRRLSDEFGGFAHMFQYGASPLLYRERLYVPLLQRNPPTYPHAQDAKPDRQSWLICIDCATGKTLWKRERSSDALEEAMEAYTTPILHESGRGLEIVVAGADCVTGHDVQTGAERWRYPGLNLRKNRGGRIVPSPVSTPGMVFVCGPKREMLIGLRDPTPGLLTTNALAWKTESNVPDVCTPLYYRDRLFVLDGDRQTMTCYLPATGERLWQGKFTVRQIFYSSPTAADGKIYCLSEEGTVVVLSAGDKFEVLSTIPMGEGPSMSSVAIANGRLYIRTAKYLYAISNRT